MKPDIKYRPEVDGLRAVAVLPVILFHAGFEVFSGGFVGVDVFFVISGYLITGIIHGEIAEGRFSLLRFYERRIRRILPALFLVCAACIPFAWMWMLPDEFRNFSQSLVAVNLFASNFLFWKESGYFEQAAEWKPLLHTWSLAVEEQFYVFFPLLLLLFRRMRRHALLILIGTLSLLSLALAEWGAHNYPSATFFLLPTRAWELGVGAILALTAERWKNWSGAGPQAGAAAGLLMIAYAVFFFDKTVPFPGLWALVPVLGTAFIIAFARPEGLVGRVLASSPFVGIGLISYSAYLWHQPLFVFARIRLWDGVSPLVYLALSVAALVLAYLSWRFVEQPFRDKRRVPAGRIFAGAAACAMVITAFGISGHLAHGFPGREGEKAEQYAALAAWQEDKNPRAQACHAREDKFIKPEKACEYGEGLAPRVAIWGDSHAKAFTYELALQLNAEGVGLKQFSYTTCPPIVGIYTLGWVSDCTRYNSEVMRYLTESSTVDTVVLVARWTLYAEGARFRNGEGGVEPGDPVYALPVGKGHDYISDPGRTGELGRLERETVQRLLDAGKHVVVIFPVPEAGWDVPIYLARELQFGASRDEPLSTSSEVFRKRSE